MQLRPYQVSAVDDLRARVGSGRRRVLLVAPTGSGKTTIAAEMIRGAIGRDGAVLFLAHRKELIDQCSQRLDGVGVDHGVVMAQHRRSAPWCPVQVASIPTLAKRLDRLPRATLVIVDEAHHARAERPQPSCSTTRTRRSSGSPQRPGASTTRAWASCSRTRSSRPRRAS
jgi:DNA repair protein RadD